MHRAASVNSAPVTEEMDVKVLSTKCDEFPRLRFLEQIGEFTVVCVDAVPTYEEQSDYNDDVKAAIFKNTTALTNVGTDLILVLQEDVEFTVDAQSVLTAIKTAVHAMEAHAADLFFLGYHPESTSDPIELPAGVVRFTHVIHWQAVIFRRGVLAEVTVPRGEHSDHWISREWIASEKLVALGLKTPIAAQSTDKWSRWLEYGIAWQTRAATPWGDPALAAIHWLLTFLVVLLICAILCVMLHAAKNM
jgi:hypothetical protein